MTAPRARKPRSTPTKPAVDPTAVGEAAAKAALSAREHKEANQHMIQQAIDAAVEKALGKQPPAISPRVQVIVGTIVGLLAIGTAVWGGVNSYSNHRSELREMANEIKLLKERGVELAAARVPDRMQAVEATMRAVELSISTATRLRDQQQQAMADRLRSMELADQSATQQANALGNLIAGLIPRIEAVTQTQAETTRRLERMENRLSVTPRPNSDGEMLPITPGLVPGV